jgi:hypothetical protein
LRSPQQGDVETASAFKPQRVYGNQALAGSAALSLTANPASVVRRARLVVQPKLTLGPVDDAYEREADSVASRVVQAMHAPQTQGDGAQPSLQRQEEEEELQMKPAADTLQRQEEEEELQMKPAADALQRQEDEEEPLQGKRTGPDTASAIDPALESQIQRARGGGSALDPSARGAMEGAMGTDFSSVRVHTGSESDSLNKSLSARAFTTGSDIFFRSGEYNPATTQGQQLLAHELTHVVQQGAAVRTKRMAVAVQRTHAARDLFFGATLA